MERRFTVTWDYRCPFARNAHEHVLAALAAGAPWDVTFVPFSLNQAHVADGGVDVWDDPDKAPALLALLAGIVVRDRDPERFADAHLALFAARHDEGRDIREADVVADVLRDVGVDADAVLTAIDDGWPREVLRKEHTQAVEQHRVFGVPTFVAGDEAVFVRLMHRPAGDPDVGRAAVEQVLDLLTGSVELNEFKRTAINR